MRHTLAVLATALAAAAGCAPPSATSILDRGPRFPDQEGIVVEVAPDRIRLDGDRVYRIDGEVESFTTRGHDPTPLMRWKDKYVHIGLDEQQRVVWVAGIGIVAKQAEPVVFYTGVFEGVERGRAVFRDGTVLLVPETVDLPEPGTEVIVTIDPRARLVSSLRRA